MNGTGSAGLSTSVDARFFAQPPWTTQSPEWIELDREIEPDHPVRRIACLTDNDLNGETLAASYSGRGTHAHRPDLLLKLVIYEHSKGQPQPTQWFTDRHENKP